jgi:hypothetical protein
VEQSEGERIVRVVRIEGLGGCVNRSWPGL